MEKHEQKYIKIYTNKPMLDYAGNPYIKNGVVMTPRLILDEYVAGIIRASGKPPFSGFEDDIISMSKSWGKTRDKLYAEEVITLLVNGLDFHDIRYATEAMFKPKFTLAEGK